jgi:hypothetical protein
MQFLILIHCNFNQFRNFLPKSKLSFLNISRLGILSCGLIKRR